MKICPLGAELFHADDGRTDRHDEANSRFSRFCERVSKPTDFTINEFLYNQITRLHFYVDCCHVPVFIHRLSVENIQISFPSMT